MGPDLSHVGPALRLALRSWRTGDDVADASPAPRRRVAVEREGIRIDPSRLRSYLACTRGGSISAEAAVPPVYPALWETAMVLELLAEGEVRIPKGGMVHLGGEVVQVRALRVGDRVRCRLELDRVEPDPGGTRLTLVGRNWNAAGQLCIEDVMRVLLRAAGTGERGPRPARREGEPEPEGTWALLADWEIRGGQGRRYAVVSGDYNPIHLWRWSSRIFGYERPILHGYCIEAMVAHDLVAQRLGGDPSALRRLEISFRAPLLIPAAARLEVSDRADGGGGRFRLLLPDRRRPVCDGVWVGRS